jgi:hypothetical protein
MAKRITKIRSVSTDGGACPDGDTCPTLWRTDASTRIVQGAPVTDPGVLSQLNLPPGEIAVEVPDTLWEER